MTKKVKGQTSLFGEEEKNECAAGGNEQNNTQPKKKDSEFQKTEKTKIIYAKEEKEIEPGDQKLDEKGIWEKYLKEWYPEFRFFDYVSMTARKEDGAVLVSPKLGKMG